MKKKARPFLVAIVGGSGAGKSWLADKLADCFGSSAQRLSQDDFYLDRAYLTPRQRKLINYDHPHSIDWDSFQNALRRCRLGKSGRVPRYDFQTHSRLLSTQTLKATPFVFVDGLWLLRRPPVRALFQFNIFLDCPNKIRLDRRLKRDLLDRGRTTSSVRKQFWDTVEPMHKKYVQTQSRFADVVLGPKLPASKVAILVSEIRSRAANPE